MRKTVLGILASAALALGGAQPAAAAQLITGSTISIAGPVITNTADASQATALDFTTGAVSNGAAPGSVTSYVGGGGSFAGLFCAGPCGTINDITSLTVGPQALSPFFVLTNGITFSLTNITMIDRSVAGFLSFQGSGVFTGSIGATPIDATAGTFSLSTQGGNVTTFSASTTAVPEPATWAMMLLGFAGIGMAMRRRRQPTLAQIA